jgi:ribonuclease D
MQYLTQPDEIHEAIIKCASARILWLDTEIADYKSGKPRLSLIQVLDDATDTQADCPPVTDKDDRILILDLLDRSELIYEFIDKIMLDPTIEKVFHNASYDRQLLGKSKAKNVTCTWEIAKKIPYYILPVPNYQLKTLAQQLCHFSNIDKTQQISDWGQRPLTAKQLEYAKMDVVYVAQVHHQLLQLSQRLEIDPDNEDLTALTLRYRQIEHRWKVLDTEFKHLKERLKQAMASQNVPELNGFKLSIQERKHKKIAFDELAKFTQEYGVNLDFPIRLTQEIQKEMTNIIEKIPIEEEVEKVFMLKVSEVEDDDLPF